MKQDGVLRPRENFPHQLEAYLSSPSPQNHAANLMQMDDGAMLCVWFGGTQEGKADISIHMARLEKNATQWGEAVALSDDPARSEQNPILFKASPQETWLFYTSQVSGNQDTAIVRRRLSQDQGKTWGDALTMLGEAGTFVRQPILRLKNGVLLLGTFLCRTEEGVKWVGNDDISVILRSLDAGKTWQKHAIPESLGCVHPSLVATDEGIVAFFRSRYADFIYMSRSYDEGITWSKPQPTALPNNNSSIQAIGLKDGRIALVYNHSSRENARAQRLSLYDEIEDEGFVEKSPTKQFAKQAFWGAPRAPLMLALSADNGKTWEEKLLLEDGDGYCMTNNSIDKQNRELSYPTLYQSDDGVLHIAYTYHRQAIKYIQLVLGVRER